MSRPTPRSPIQASRRWVLAAGGGSARAAPPIARAPTGVALFIGRALGGRTGIAVPCDSLADFTAEFGGADRQSELAVAVSLFFLNGGAAALVLGLAGPVPNAAAYSAAYQAADAGQTDFDLLVLPRDVAIDPTIRRALWAPAAAWCARRRAFLVMDPPDEWTDAPSVLSPYGGIEALRADMVRDHAAVFYPRLEIVNGSSARIVGPSGAIAGLMARTDAARGVWKAPAGMQADLRGVTGVERALSSAEAGALNIQGVNAIRRFPQGVLTWGSRTLDGADQLGSDYKYIPVRRTALFLEQSLDQGLQWVVFEPNGPALWAQIRNDVAGFLQGLFLDGAFQGRTPQEAWFVACDANTMTQQDIDNGVVNLVIGFAPLKPAEFVILDLRKLTARPPPPP